MINVNKTIYKNILNKINALRFQAEDNKKGFKDLISLIIIDDLLEWAPSMDEHGKVISKLEAMRRDFILCAPSILPEYIDISTAYVNVNTPLSSDTWKRVWDAEGTNNDYIKIEIPIYPTNPSEEPDPCSCMSFGGILNYL